ncbi:membrane protein [Enterococcus florum]|uniref:Membrane protein n=1 Tax=Enterococcus florum TaxID=2480627 RepID=A0A4P5P451_9ENTE|nr:DUF1129 family protein [Enterococcus florum]GCF92380.1 membrane protein [Enterococcus florum]
MEPEKLQTLTAENRQIETQLTKRNEQYIFDLKKSMEAANLSEEERETALHEMLTTLVSEQKSGKTARQLYGTVSERLDAIVNKPEEKPISTRPSLMILDNFMFLFGILTLVTGGMALFVSRGTQVATYGLTALLVASGLGAVIFYMMYLLIYQYEYPGADKSKKPKTWKAILALGSMTLAWFLIFNAAIFLPTQLNPFIDPFVLVTIGAGFLALRYYLKKRFGIISSLASPRQVR